MSSKKQAGFTILELTIATAIFSTVLLVVTAGIISFTKSYLAGVHRAQTQETARLVMEELTQSLQFTSGWRCYNGTCPAPAPAVQYAYCFGNVKYSFHTNVVVGGTNHALVRSPYDGSDCTPRLTGLNANDTELLGDNMRLSKFSITDKGDGSFTIDMGIIYGAADLIAVTGDRCASGPGSQFCAASNLTTTVQRRL